MVRFTRASGGWLLWVLLALSAPVRAQWHVYRDTAMTTSVELEFWAEDADRADAIAERVLAVFHQVDRQMSRYRDDSELSRVNRDAAQGPVPVSDSLFRVLAKAQAVSELSQGAFDITFGSVGYFYDFRAGRKPSEAELQQGLAQVDYRAVELDPQARTVHFRHPGVVTDLGGIAKGYAVDLGVERLRQAGVRHARLSAGGDMRLHGDKRGRPWLVGVKDPRADGRQAVVLPLSEVSISTSGDYERFFIDESGERIHHILSPRTGKPVHGVQSVTVLGPDTLSTDGLSTAVFVLGWEQGLAMIEALDGFDAIVIDDQRRMHFTSGLGAPEAP